MNLKHEMFWNLKYSTTFSLQNSMNLKHEMFWNKGTVIIKGVPGNEP